jgi:hypothetical protein
MSEQFTKNIKSWVQIDTQLKLINEHIKPLREKKSSLIKDIAEYVQNNQLQKKRIEITDGSLGFYEKKEYSALTYGYIEKCLGEIISDKKNVEYIITYLREHREVKKGFDIRRSDGRSRSKSIVDDEDDSNHL